MGYEIRIDGYHTDDDTSAAVEKKTKKLLDQLSVYYATITDDAGTRILVKQPEDPPEKRKI